MPQNGGSFPDSGISHEWVLPRLLQTLVSFQSSETADSDSSCQCSHYSFGEGFQRPSLYHFWCSFPQLRLWLCVGWVQRTETFHPSRPTRQEWVTSRYRCPVQTPLCFPIFEDYWICYKSESKTHNFVFTLRGGLWNIGEVLTSYIFTVPGCPFRKGVDGRLASLGDVVEGHVTCFCSFHRDLMCKMAVVPDWHIICPYTRKFTHSRPHSSPCRVYSRSVFQNMFRPSSCEYSWANGTDSACWTLHRGLTRCVVSPIKLWNRFCYCAYLLYGESETQVYQATCPKVMWFLGGRVGIWTQTLQEPWN